MAYTYPLALPTNTGLSSIIITPMSYVAVTQSPWSGDQQVQGNPGQFWMADVVLPVMARADAALWEAFFLKLNGKQFTFLLGHTGETAPLGVATGTPLVSGSSQTGQTLATEGWTAGQTNILKAGTWLQLGTGSTSRLYRTLDNQNSDGGGLANLNLWPNVITQNSPSDDDPIVINSAQGVFRMSSDNVPFNTSTASLYNYSFKAISLI